MRCVEIGLPCAAVFLHATLPGAAAQLPSRKAEAAEYLKVCDAFGAGYFWIPGADICLRLGGRGRGEYAYINSAASAFVSPQKTTATGGFAPAGAANATFAPGSTMDQTGFLTRARVDLDARARTPWGDLRTFISIRPEIKTGLYGDNGLTGVVTGQTGKDNVFLENAIIQFAGFTFGRTTSETFAFMPPWNYASFGWAGFPVGIGVLTYTASFGGGLSATIGLEDRGNLTAANAVGYEWIGPAGAAAGASVLAVATTTPWANGVYALPAAVGNLRLDQTWGAAQAMAGVIQNTAVSNFATSSNNGTIAKTGWAVGAGLKINLPMIAPGDVLHLTAEYADGALEWLQSSSTSAHTGNIGREFNGLLRQDKDLYVFPTSSAGACAAPATATAACFSGETTKGYSIAGMFTHFWSASLRSNLMASYLNLTPGVNTRNIDWTLGGLGPATSLEIGGSLIWSPSRDFDIGLEVVYERLNQTLSATSPANSGTGVPTPIPAAWGGWTPGSTILQTRLRIERTF